MRSRGRSTGKIRHIAGMMPDASGVMTTNVAEFYGIEKRAFLGLRGRMPTIAGVMPELVRQLPELQNCTIGVVYRTCSIMRIRHNAGVSPATVQPLPTKIPFKYKYKYKFKYKFNRGRSRVRASQPIPPPQPIFTKGSPNVNCQKHNPKHGTRIVAG